MICKKGGFTRQRHNEIREIEAEMLQAVCTDVKGEPVFQKVTVEGLTRGANKLRLLMGDWISVFGASGRENRLHSLMSGYATLMRTTREREKTSLLLQSPVYFYATCTCNYWRYVQRMPALPQPSRRTKLNPLRA